MVRFLLLTAAVCLPFTAVALAADHHGHFNDDHVKKHLKATPDGKVTHGKIKGHDVHTHHAKGKVKGVSVGNKAHSKAHKVKGVHKNSTKTHASLERSGDWE